MRKLENFPENVKRLINHLLINRQVIRFKGLGRKIVNKEQIKELLGKD